MFPSLVDDARNSNDISPSVPIRAAYQFYAMAAERRWPGVPPAAGRDRFDPDDAPALTLARARDGIFS
jgi:hypothetical protein